MSKPYKSLPEALRGIITKEGEKMLEDVKLVNILADLCSLEDMPAANTILKKVLTEGYGTEILTITSSPSWEMKLKVLSAKISSKNGYRSDIVQYIVDSVVYGLGKSEIIPKYIDVLSSPAKSMASLEIELRKLKGDYLRFLEENVMVSDDSPAYFLTDDKSEVFELREKIRILSDALGKDDLTWCDEKMNEVLEENSPKAVKLKKKGFFKRLFGS